MEMLSKLMMRSVFIVVVAVLSGGLSSGYCTTFSVTNNNDAGAGSLRQAIIDANTDPSYPHLIEFSSFVGSPIITPGSLTFDKIVNPTKIDGTTHPSYVGVPVITIDASNLAPGTSAFNFGYENQKVFFITTSAKNSHITGLKITDDPASGIAPQGVHVDRNVTGVRVNEMFFENLDDGVLAIENNVLISQNKMVGCIHGVHLLDDCAGLRVLYNEISFSTGPGIYSRASNTEIKFNTISDALEKIGILIINEGIDGDASNNLVKSNHIFNIGYGVAVYAGIEAGSGDFARYNTITENSIHNVTIRAIDLQYPSDGPGNDSKEMPEISSATSDGVVSGTAQPGDIVELFVGNGQQEAEVFRGSTVADLAGDWSLTIGNVTYTHVTATATDPLGTNGSNRENTSELANLPVTVVAQIEPCETCVGSFSLQPGKSYLVGAWAKEAGAPADKFSFDQTRIRINFSTPGGIVSTAYFLPQGQIIDQWQRIEELFTVPIDATDMEIEMSCASGDCFFDDIRVFPFDASMKTYVYDPIFMRLAAELDERHYATFYEYSEEGQLVRIKKETEKGVLTIQETTNNSSK